MPGSTIKCEQLSIKLEEPDDDNLAYNEFEETSPRMHLEPTPVRSITDPANISNATPGPSRHATPIVYSMPQPQAAAPAAQRPPRPPRPPPPSRPSSTTPFTTNRPEMTYRRSRVVCEQTIPQNQPGPSVPISRLTFPNGKTYYAAMVEANSVSDQEWFDFQQLFTALGTVRDILRTIFIKEVDMRRMEGEDEWECDDVQEDVRRTTDIARGHPHDVRAQMRASTTSRHVAPLAQSTPRRLTDGARTTTATDWSADDWSSTLRPRPLPWQLRHRNDGTTAPPSPSSYWRDPFLPPRSPGQRFGRGNPRWGWNWSWILGRNWNWNWNWDDPRVLEPLMFYVYVATMFAFGIFVGYIIFTGRAVVPIDFSFHVLTFRF